MADPKGRLTRHILERCRQAGFALAGVAPVIDLPTSRHLRDWLAAGKHGEMDYLLADLDTRLEPRGILPGTRSFIVVADQYATRGDTDPPPDAANPLGRIARYARGRNYHDVVKRRLHALADRLRLEHPGVEFRTCVDTAPVPERALAVLAGLGWQAKNTMVIHPALGSWFFLAVVATTLDLEPADAVIPDACGTCTRCIDACPTRAITPYSVDATRCISYLTIEHRGPIDPGFHRSIGDWVFGCDVCQEVCPHNSPRQGPGVGEPHPAYLPRRDGFPLLDMLGWTTERRREALQTSAMKRATLAMMKRNAIIAAGNAADTCSPHAAAALRRRLRELSQDPEEPELIRRTASQVLARLDGA